jgi:hypothetical protein
METKVFPAVKRLAEEDGNTKNVSTARNFDLGQEERIDRLQTRLGRFLGRLASRTALSPERAADIWKRVSDSAHK